MGRQRPPRIYRKQLTIHYKQLAAARLACAQALRRVIRIRACQIVGAFDCEAWAVDAILEEWYDRGLVWCTDGEWRLRR